jgi:transglutaminase-like putative cysteine protease
MRFSIVHRTEYQYATPVRESFNEVRLKPPSNEHQTVETFILRILPACRLRHYEDFYKNVIHHFDIPELHSQVLIEATMTVATRDNSLPLDATPAPLTRLPECGRTERCFDYLMPSRYVDLDPETWRLAIDITSSQTDIWQASVAIMRYIYSNFRYTPASTHVHTHMRDMLGLCRALKIPALYVSGYLATETASASHAWVEVFIPDVGWRGLDPTHNCSPDGNYVKIAVGRDYSDVAPVSGNYRGTLERKMTVSVQIQRLD